ncbi:MAG: hypothetical protein Q8M31_16280 [Beijerinckiaceae bacterium]|nr:hypothetical protein [Beijerinckiaceae bacterium]
MSARARFTITLAALAVAGVASAQQIPHTPGQIPPYVDPNNPPFQLPPGPSDPLDRLYPGPLRPDPIPDTQTPVPAPYPRGQTPRPPSGVSQGYTMTINRAGIAMATGALSRPRQLGEHLAACWEPPAAGSEVSVRVSFSRSGEVIGSPRVTYVKPGQGVDRAAVVRSVQQAFARCLPLRFTADLGSAIAGRPFAFRFIAPGAARP